MTVRNARRVLTGLGLGILAAAVLLPDSRLSALLILLCALAAVAVLWRHLPALSQLEEDNPKVLVLRRVTLFSVSAVAAMVLLAWLLESGRLRLSPDQTKWLLAVLFALLILIFGNMAPMLPCTRYTGLRLPWTVRDEQTWLVAHRILGWLSLPFASLSLAAGAIPYTELAVKAVVGVLLGWIAIPSVLSLVFYLKKYRKL